MNSTSQNLYKYWIRAYLSQPSIWRIILTIPHAHRILQVNDLFSLMSAHFCFLGIFPKFKSFVIILQCYWKRNIILFLLYLSKFCATLFNRYFCKNVNFQVTVTQIIYTDLVDKVIVESKTTHKKKLYIGIDQRIILNTTKYVPIDHILGGGTFLPTNQQKNLLIAVPVYLHLEFKILFYQIQLKWQPNLFLSEIALHNETQITQ